MLAFFLPPATTAADLEIELPSQTPADGLGLAFLLEETARKILPEAVLTCCVSGNIHMFSFCGKSNA